MARYAPGGVPNTQDIAQLERWLREETERIQGSTEDIYKLAEFLVTLYVVAGYGSIGLDAITGLPNITATWQTLPFDVLLIDPPRGANYDLPNDGMGFDLEGVWRVNAKISLEFAEVNAGRRLQLRIWNLTQGITGGIVFQYTVGRNTDGVNLNLSVMTTIEEANVGDVLQLQVASSSDTFTAVQAIGSTWDINHVSEYKGDLLNDSLRQTSRVNTWQ
jgi:hypothetical protein